MIKKIIMLVFVLTMIQVVSAVCPAGFPDTAVCGETGGVINYAPDGWLCSDDRTELENWENGILGSTISTQVLRLVSPFGNCYAPQDPTTQFCCQSGYICNYTNGDMDPRTSSEWRECLPTLVNYCGNYSYEFDCNNDIANVAEQTIEIFIGKGEGYCSGPIDSTSECDFVSCGCVWDGDAATGVCKSIETIKDYDCDTGKLLNEDGTCIRTYLGLEDSCKTLGRMTVGWTALGTLKYLTGDLSSECQDGTNTFPCMDVVSLDFFSLRNIILAVLIIIIIYVLMKRKKK